MASAVSMRLSAVSGRCFVYFSLLSLSGVSCAQSVPPPPQRLRVSEASTSPLLLEKIPPKYPEDAAKAGVEGTVVLKLVIDTSGAVHEVTTVSGDPALAQAASDAVRQWKYKPYLIDGTPAEIETQATLNFHLAHRPAAGPPPPGVFGNGVYTNEYFGLSYPLPSDWVRVTQLTRKQLTSEGKSGAASVVLLSAVHIPQDMTKLRSDAHLTLMAVPRSAASATGDCTQYLDALTSALHSTNSAKRKGEVSTSTGAGHEFWRANFEYKSEISDHATICSPANDYLLLWDMQGFSKGGVNLAAATINAITFRQPTAKREEGASPASPSTAPRVRVTEGLTTGLIIKKVQPVYPSYARSDHIQGTVVLQALISKAGDIEDLELIDGPIELAVSAVTAVRQWKYKPYLLLGNPVDVETQVVVNYKLTR